MAQKEKMFYDIAWRCLLHVIHGCNSPKINLETCSWVWLLVKFMLDYWIVILRELSYTSTWLVFRWYVNFKHQPYHDDYHWFLWAFIVLKKDDIFCQNSCTPNLYNADLGNSSLRCEIFPYDAKCRHSHLVCSAWEYGLRCMVIKIYTYYTALI